MSTPNDKVTLEVPVTVDYALFQIVMQQALALHEQTGALVGLCAQVMAQGEKAALSGAGADSPVSVGADGVLQRKETLPPRFGRTTGDQPQDSTPTGAADGRQNEGTVG